ncbi:MAG: polysaccharide deacetylase family protein, partial [Alphaproteobacteria bacterium]
VVAPDALARLAGGGVTPALAHGVLAHRFRASASSAVAHLHQALTRATAGRTPWASPFLTPERVRQAAADGGVDFGAHTANHPSLAACGDDELEREVVTSRDAVAAWTGRPPAWFAYPYGGRAHVDARTVRAVGRAGFAGAVTLVPGYASADTDPLRVPRVPIGAGHGLAEFRARLLGAPVLRTLTRVSARVPGVTA